MGKENITENMGQTEEQCICKTDGLYPEALRRISHGPVRLYVRGCLPEETIPSVAVIGARRCSSYGKEMAQWFAEELALSGVQIISGMALGIDGIAQRAALSAGGSSFGVLGCGTDVCYPEANRDLYDMLLQKGGILSEYPAGAPPLPGHFPARNRLISALSDIVLVIEAKEKSGTLITVDFALEQGKDVYVLPGRLTDALSSGCNRLIRQGAGIALTPADILEALPDKGGFRKPSSGGGTDGKVSGSGMEKRQAVRHWKGGSREKLVWEQMGERPVTLQELYEKIKSSGKGKDMKLSEVMDSLMNLVMQEMVSQERGSQYQRKTGISVSSI